MDYSRASLNRLSTDTAYKVCCEAVSDIDTDDDCKYSAECDTDRARNRLNNTDYR